MGFKSGFVSLVGRPNVGKSTILNAFLKEKVAITSNKPQTTRNAIRGVLTDCESQIIFIDTPGIHKPKSKLGDYMIGSAMENIGGVDLVLFVVEPTSEKIMQEDFEILLKIAKSCVPAIMVLNKVDTVSKEKILPLIDKYRQKMDFKAIVPVSALKAENLDALLSEIKSFLEDGPQYFPEDTLTDQPERVLVGEMIREKILKNLDEEVPHGIGVEIVSFREREDKELIEIGANIYCERDTHKGIVIGKKGAMLKKIGSEARIDMESFLNTKVFLELWVKVKEDWRNSNYMLKSLGYIKK
jgi:GTP-binding protein Era